MNFPATPRLLTLLAALVILIALVRPSAATYAAILPLVLFALVYWRARAWRDGAFYLVLAGTLLVAVMCSATVWAGLAAAWLVALIVAPLAGIDVMHAGTRALLIAAGATAAVTLLADTANHVLLPFALLCCGACAVLGVLAIRMYRFRKQYAGGAA